MQYTYNDAQKQAIAHREGPMLVLAGPGSGKTRVITARTAVLIEEGGIDPKNILVITFTRAAAAEMKKRFLESYGDYSGVTFGTFHSVFFRILRIAYGMDGGCIITEEDRMSIMRAIVRETEVDTDDEGEFISGLFSEISVVKNEQTGLEHYHAKTCGDDVFRAIYEAYDAALRKKNKIDFDDILVMCYDLLSKRPDILRIWQDRYQYILIDEFQDINRIQYEIVKMLAEPRHNLFIVGDDDQSIYSFRGAKPELMFQFQKDYTDAKQVLLAINYRCQRNVTDAAGRLIAKNKTRFEKEITANRPPAEPVDMRTFKNAAEENGEIIRLMHQYHEEGIPYGEMAVLFRTNMGPRLLLQKLMEYNIPFRMRDNVPNLYDHFIAKDVISYIRIAGGSHDRADYLRIANRPNRYIKKDSLNTREITLRQLVDYYHDKPWMYPYLIRFSDDMKILKQQTPQGAVHYIRNVIGYQEYLADYAAYRRMKPEELYEVLDELAESAKEYRTCEEWFAGMKAYTERLEQEKAQQKNDGKHVMLSTMHSSKGLEYQAVFLIDCNEGVVPHQKALLPEEIEEERRMFYVAMTRAKDHLHIFSVRERFEKEADVSRFLGEILFEPGDYKPGGKILHKTYGEGEVKKLENGVATIWFPRMQKTFRFNLEYAVSNRLIELK